MPRKKTNRRPKINKSAFVRGLPASMSAGEVVQRAKAAGVKLTDRYVYVIRSKAKAKGGARKPTGAKRGPKPGRKAAAASASGLATQFLEAAVDLGLVRAEDLLVSLRAKVKQAIGG